MKFIQGQNRTQINLFPVSLDKTIDADNEVRIIDLFVDSLSIRDYGFRTDYIAYGRPAYHPSDLLKESGEAQISISDPESRQIMLRNNITEVAYNVQSMVDSKNNLPNDYKVTNENDSKAMGSLPITLTTTSISNTTGRTIPTPVPRDRFCAPTGHGIKRKQVQVTLSGLSSIKPGHAEIVRYVHIVPDRRRRG